MNFQYSYIEFKDEIVSGLRLVTLLGRYKIMLKVYRYYALIWMERQEHRSVNMITFFLIEECSKTIWRNEMYSIVYELSTKWKTVNNMLNNKRLFKYID